MLNDHLEPNQKTTISRLLALLTDFANATDQAESECFPLVTSSIGLFGGRGSGKSTLLWHLFHHGKPRQSNCEPPREPVSEEGEWRDLRNNCLVLKPLDCSILPRECEPGMAVLCHVSQELDRRWNDPDNPCHETGLFDELQGIIGHYTLIGAAYNELSLELSSTPEDYGEYRARGLHVRLALEAELSGWLEKFFKFLNKQRQNQKILVVLLDDFDLVPAAALETQRWIPSLLGELAQRRLVCVLSADFHRLEHLSWYGNKHTDDETGRALVNKLFPPQNRVSISAWSNRSRLHFRPNGQERNSRPNLWELIQAKLDGEVLSEGLIYSLLPDFPRGLEGLYLSLLPKPASMDDTATKRESDANPFLSLLATNRKESLLARRLDFLNSEAWVAELRFEDKDMTVERWATLVQRASLRPQFRIHMQMKETEAETQCLPELELLIKYEKPDFSYVKASAGESHDPQRHDDLHTRPLRDANEGERGLWAELLWDMNLARSPRHRVGLLLGWKPTHSRLDRAGFELQFNLEFMRKFILNNPQVEQAVFYWMQEMDEPRGYTIGWPPLFAALRGERDAFSPEFFGDLWLANPLLLQGERPCPDVLDLLPNRLWSLILFTDGLYRCPWLTFSGASIWMVSTYIGLAAAFVRSAYAYALDLAFSAKPVLVFSPQQRQFVEMINTRDPAQFLAKGKDFRREEDVLLALRDLFVDDFEQQIKDKRSELEQAKDKDATEAPVLEMLSLISAAAAFLKSPVYQSVKTLLAPYWKNLGIE